MHTFKPGMEIETPPRNIQQAYNTMDEYHNWLLMNDKFIVKSVGKETAEIQGDKTLLTYHLKISDLNPKSEVFKVRVVSAKPYYWYADKIGSEFEIEVDEDGDYQVIGSTGGIILKSDCIVVTDQKFKVDGYVEITGDKESGHGFKIGDLVTIISINERDNDAYCTNGQHTAHVNFVDMIPSNQPTSHPFTEELFNQGKYEVWIYDDTIVEDMHKHNGKWYSDLGLMDISKLTLKEKEVVVYHAVFNSGLIGSVYLSLEECVSQNKFNSVNMIMIIKTNLTTRTVEKVWDYLTDNK